VSDTATLLVELGTEELPPKALLRLSNAFAEGVAAGLGEADLSFGQIKAFATPRRLAVAVEALAVQQPTRKVERRGPPVERAFDAAGAPTKAATAFANKCGVPVESLDRQATDKGEWLFYAGAEIGLATTALVPDIIATALAKLPIPKRMRWGSSDVEFVRPVHWLVMLLDTELIPATVLGQTAGRDTYGHRFHAPAAITLKHADDYATSLLSKGWVIADFSARRKKIIELAQAAGGDGEALLNAAIVEEVTALVEWPVALTGHFPERFLNLPPEVLTSTLQDHQKYFPVTSKGKLTNAFIAIANLDSSLPDEVRRGNERVVLPRLADADFFWNQDVRKKLAERCNDLAAVVYQKGLGTLHDKTLRVASLAREIAPLVKADISQTERAAELAKTDLLTDMVGEFPELQGRMGYYYALHDGEHTNVATAIEEQYLPRHANDELPASAAGCALSIAEKLDTLAGIFALGKKPSGNKDPFGLRRLALGLVRIAITKQLDLNIPQLIDSALELQPVDGDRAEAASQLYDFILDRARSWYLDGHSPLEVNAELFHAVRSRNPASLLDLHHRLNALVEFARLDAATSLSAANKRIANILKSADTRITGDVDTGLFAEDAERQLFSAVSDMLDEHRSDLAASDYASALQRLANLRDPVDQFFEQVMVMTDDEGQRNNRLLLLSQLRKLFLDIADISALPAKS
jgi:glycyl-tRNA synthetase beta chain